MKKRRIATTISAKHWSILEKHKIEYETYQKTIEYALENLENNSENGNDASPVEQLWMRIGNEMMPSFCLLNKSLYRELINTADYEKIKMLVTRMKPAEYLVVWYNKKPLNKCSLKEVIDSIIFTTKVGNQLNTINCTDCGRYYTLSINHDLNMKGSKLFKIYFEDLFISYGVKSEIELGEISIFIKVYKDTSLLLND